MTISNTRDRGLRFTGVVHTSPDCRVFARPECVPHTATAAELLDGRRCKLCAA